MVGQNRFSISGLASLFPKGEADQNKHNTSARSRICPVCRDAERLRVEVPYGDPSFGKSVPCSCVEAQQTALRLQQQRQAAKMDAFRESTFKTFNSSLPGLQEAYRMSVAFAAKPHGWLLLVGPCGCGKTHLAAAIANQCLDKGATIYFTTVPDLLDDLRATFTTPERYTQLFDRVRKVELLILDDLGAQRPSAWSNEKLLQILNQRATFVLPTIITAIPKEFQELDERLRSRLSDAERVTTITVERGKDFRPLKRTLKRSE